MSTALEINAVHSMVFSEQFRVPFSQVQACSND